jgi:saccharopine dehydrogenase (NADP+, L-glutamate forming)/spermidine synthase
MKTALVLGAGLVARPLVQYLLETSDIQVIVASRTVSKAKALIRDHPQGQARELEVENTSALRELVSEADIVVSLLPYTYHVKIAKLCLEFGKDMVTTSYVSPEMRALDGRAKEKGITILNEIGVDPGIDHMSAMEIIDRVEEQGGQITSFRSWCGGLPAPEANTNPLGYKFSWSPRGVLLAGRNAAHYLEEGKEVDIPGEELFEHHWSVDVPGATDLEGYPNRDAVPYASLYGIESADTIFRGTLRNPGWSATLDKIVELGLLELEEQDWSGVTFKEFMGQLVNYQGQDVRAAVADRLNLEPGSFIMDNLSWLGLFEDEPLPVEHGAPIDILTARMLEKMSYEDKERDMLIMHHEFIATYPDHKQAITSTMIDYGIPGGDSSMSRTVGLPAAIATRLILEGKIDRKGVLIPVTPDIYEPVMKELEQMGIHFDEKVHRLEKNT